MADPITELNETAVQSGAEVSVAMEAGGLNYRIGKLTERYLVTATYDLVLQLAKRTPLTKTTIDLAGCRVVSSIELTLIGYIVMQTRFHGGSVRMVGASPVNRRALAMVGFDRLVELPA